MNRKILATALMVISASVMVAQQASQQSGYQGTSTPPADDSIVSDEAQQSATPQAPQKPAPGKPLTPAAAPNVPATPVAAPNQVQPPLNAAPAQQTGAQNSPPQAQADQRAAAAASSDPSVDGTDAGIVGVQATSAPMEAQQPAPMSTQPMVAANSLPPDPDGDIVHPRALRPGELPEGTAIRVRLMDRLSTALTEKGEPFHSQVASDVLQGGQVVIAAGTEIDGTVVAVSTGHVGGSGSMRLRPESIVLADGTRYRIYADVTGTPGSNTRVVGEGTIKAGSRAKRDGIEYGGAVGVGVIAGAAMGGPVGALTGGLIGAGAITAHLLISHPQATLEPGTTLMLELTGPLQMTPMNQSGN
jgi:hypothetical protein